MTLDNIMTKHGSDKSSWGHNYCPYYESWFEPMSDAYITLLELGIGGEDTELGGKSLLAWKDYFPYGTIIGVDIYDKKELDSKGIITYQGSQDDPKFLMNIIKKHGRPDIIIDDCSHRSPLTIKSFEILFPRLKDGGLYCIEDLECSYDQTFDGNPNLVGEGVSIMNYLFQMLHNLHPVENRISNFNRNILFNDVKHVHFYPNLVIIQKK